MLSYDYSDFIGLRCFSFQNLYKQEASAPEGLHRALLWLHGYYSGRDEAMRTSPNRDAQLSLIIDKTVSLCDDAENDPYTYLAYDEADHGNAPYAKISLS